MTKNMGSVDRILRFAAAALALILVVTHQVSGILAVVLGVVAAVLVVTSFIGVGPAYIPLKFSTARKPAD